MCSYMPGEDRLLSGSEKFSFSEFKYVFCHFTIHLLLIESPLWAKHIFSSHKPNTLGSGLGTGKKRYMIFSGCPFMPSIPM